MNRKYMTIAGTIALGSVILGATAYGAISGTSGYDLYKEAVKNSYAAQSITPKTELTVKDNGNVLVKVDTTTKIDKTNKAMSNIVTMSSAEGQKTIDMYRQDDKTIIKNSDSDVYNVMEPNKARELKRKEHKEDDPSRVKDIENVADALVGNIQNYITLDNNTDGTKEVSLELTDSQISPVINAVASLAVKNATYKEDHEEGINQKEMAYLTAIQDKLPKLVDNIRVTRVDVDAKITQNNLIQDQTENLIITGTDANGKTHEVSVSVTTDFEGYNSTVPDKVDLTNKKVNVIQHEQFKHEED